MNDREPRILFVDHTAALGGAELCLIDVAAGFRHTGSVVLFQDGPLVHRLRERGVETRVLPAARAMHAVRRGSGIGRASAAAAGLLAAARRLAPLAKQADMIYANSQKSMLVAAMTGRLTRRPVVWHLHDILSRDHFSRLSLAAAMAAARFGMTRVIANSEASRDAFVERGGDPRRVGVAYNGLDAAAFAVDAQDAAAARAEAGLPGDAFVVGCFGRFAPWKGQHHLVAAARQLPGVHVLFVGDALFGEQAYLERVEREAAEAGLAGRTRFLGFRDDVARWMAACDAVAHCSTAPEPFGRVIVEAMLAERPVVATDAGGVREIFGEEGCGMLVPPGDVTALASALAGLAASPSRRRELARAGRRRAEQTFTTTAMLDAIRRELRLIPQPTPAAPPVREQVPETAP